MTQVVYGQKGYLGSSMSVRAAEAYEQGEMPISRWTKTAIIQAVKDYCFDFDLAYDPDIENNTKAELVKEFLEYKSWHHSSRTAREVEFFGLNEDAVCRSFEPMSQEQVIERDRQMAAEQAAQKARLQFMNAREKEFEQKFGCNPSSVLAYEAVHPEMCTRFIARRKKTEMISYRLPAEAVKAGMKEEQVCPLPLLQVPAARLLAPACALPAGKPALLPRELALVFLEVARVSDLRAVRESRKRFDAEVDSDLPVGRGRVLGRHVGAEKGGEITAGRVQGDRDRHETPLERS